jgi:hypothetical protein
MNTLKDVRTYLLACSLLVALQPLCAFGQQTPVAGAATARDGQNDFDFNFGTWKTHISRLQHPLTGSTSWVEYEGTSIVRKVWNGRAGLLELEADGPAGHIEGVGLRLYNPQSRQWSLNWANGSAPALGQPMIGEFKNGRGEFFDQEPFHGRAIYVRNAFSDITSDSSRFEQAFSEDGGKTWETNWVMTFTRAENELVQNVPQTPTSPDVQHDDSQHDFDFEIGSWKIHLSRLKDRLAGSTAWVEFDGTSLTRKVWNGRANLEEFETDSSQGHIEGLTLRLYNPESRQWSIYWANGKDGMLGTPMIGEFKNGRGEFFDQEPWKGRAVYVRFFWTNTTTKSPHFEQSFSDDGGKTWEVNWITTQTRVNDESDRAH